MEQQRDRTDAEHLELVVLTLLLDPEYPWVWSVAELGRQLGNALDAADTVASLDAAGLVHRCDRFVFPTRAAMQFSLLVGGL